MNLWSCSKSPIVTVTHLRSFYVMKRRNSLENPANRLCGLWKQTRCESAGRFWIGARQRPSRRQSSLEIKVLKGCVTHKFMESQWRAPVKGTLCQNCKECGGLFQCKYSSIYLLRESWRRSPAASPLSSTGVAYWTLLTMASGCG